MSRDEHLPEQIVPYMTEGDNSDLGDDYHGKRN